MEMIQNKDHVIILLSSLEVKKYNIKENGTICDFLRKKKILNPKEIRIFLSREGGCQLFITKYKEEYIYKFKNTENFLKACKILQNSNIYIDYNKCFYVISPSELKNIKEFGGIICSQSTEYYIKEHCKKASAGASFLSKLI